jgi:hypothetical protein
MTAEQIALLGLLISTLVTSAGWIFTASVQRRILKETTKSQQLERELAVFRERLATVRGMTSTLLDQSASYHALVSQLLAPGFDFDEGAVLIQQLNAKGLELSKILYDPAFRAVRDLLPPDHSKRIFDQLKKATDVGAAYHTSAVALSPLTPNLSAALRGSAQHALQVSRELIRTADMFADAFAVLDKNLAKGRKDD